MPYSNKTDSLAKVFKTENYKRGQYSKVCLACKGKPKVITEFSTRKARGRLYLKSKCRQCDSRYVRSFRLAPVDLGPEGAHCDTPVKILGMSKDSGSGYVQLCENLVAACKGLLYAIAIANMAREYLQPNDEALVTARAAIAEAEAVLAPRG